MCIENIKTNKPRHIKQWFWGIITLGFVQPLLVKLIVYSIYKPEKFVEKLKEVLSGTNNSYLIQGILNVIPFVILAVATRILICDLKKYDVKYYSRIYGLICSGVVLTCVSLDLNFTVWISIALLRPGFSTNVIAYLLFPFIALMIMPVGYGFGWLIGKLLFKFKEVKGSALDIGQK